MTSIIVSILALIFSIVSFYISFVQNRKIENKRIRLQNALFDIQRDSVFESRLAEWPSALRFHGIDVESAKKDGLEPGDIIYLILSIGGLIAFSEAEDITVYDQLLKSDYRQRMFAQTETRTAWKYARLCIPFEQRDDIDRFLKKTYSENF
jgi:hypothetical protein